MTRMNLDSAVDIFKRILVHLYCSTGLLIDILASATATARDEEILMDCLKTFAETNVETEMTVFWNSNTLFDPSGQATSGLLGILLISVEGCATKCLMVNI